MRVLLAIIFFAFGLNATAQWVEDSVEVVRLIDQSQRQNAAEKAIAIAKQAVAKSKTFGFSMQLKASRNLFKTQLKFDENYDALRTYLELNQQLEKKGKWSEVVKNMFLLSDYYGSKKLFASAIEKNKEAETVAKNHNVAFDEWLLSIKQGDLFLAKGDFEEAKKAYTLALDFIEDEPEKALQRSITTYRKIAVVENKLQNYRAAITANKSVLGYLDGSKDEEAYATQLNNIGYSYQKLGDTKEALVYFKETLQNRENRGFNDVQNIALLINIGIAYQNLHATSNAKTYLNRAIAASTKPSQKAAVYDLMAMAFLAENDFVNAKEYNNQSVVQAKMSDNKRLEAETHLTASIINEKLLFYDQALVEFKRYLEIKDSLDALDVANQQELLQAEYAIERTQGEIQSLIASNAIKDFQIMQLRLESGNSQKQLQIQQAESKARLQALQLERAKLEAEKKEHEVAELKATKENQRLLLEQQKLQETQVVKDLQIAEEKNQVQELQLDKRNAANRLLTLVLFFAFVLAMIMIYAWRQTRKKNRSLAESREMIKQERDRSDVLLLNILPESTANELKETGKAAPKKFASATVFFSDFKNFSSLSQDYSPEELIDELEGFFGGFDKIINKYHIEKIKTIGDAYMCASGIPIESKDHAQRMVKAALEMVAFTKEVHKQQIARGKEPWHMRIGINTGPVVAGVIGTNKFIYDVWGDTVNLAARLETAGEPDRVNISQQTLDIVNDEFYTTYRGEIEVKNMGLVRMFFVDGLRKKDSSNL